MQIIKRMITGFENLDPGNSIFDCISIVFFAVTSSMLFVVSMIEAPVFTISAAVTICLTRVWHKGDHEKS